jgi:hypothetical protein
MPVRVRISTTRGGLIEEISVAHWFSGAVSAEIRVPDSMGEVTRVEIDADREFPDKDRSNNVWERG